MLNAIEYLFAKAIKKLHLRAIKGSHIHPSSKVCAGTQMVDSRMGKHSDIGYDCLIVKTNIGSFVSMGSNCRIGGASHTMDWVSTSPVFCGNKDHLPQKFSKHAFDAFVQTNIGNDVWIADGVLVRAGVTVGDGAVLGLGSVVTKDVPPYEIWGGNPARLIRKRFGDEVIAALLRIRWWDFDDETLQKKANLFNDVRAFIAMEEGR